jgi:hypothetical protein
MMTQEQYLAFKMMANIFETERTRRQGLTFEDKTAEVQREAFTRGAANINADWKVAHDRQLEMRNQILGELTAMTIERDALSQELNKCADLTRQLENTRETLTAMTAHRDSLVRSIDAETDEVSQLKQRLQAMTDQRNMLNVDLSAKITRYKWRFEAAADQRDELAKSRVTLTERDKLIEARNALKGELYQVQRERDALQQSHATHQRHFALDRALNEASTAELAAKLAQRLAE